MNSIAFYNPGWLAVVIGGAVLVGVILGFFLGLLYFIRIKGGILARQHKEIKRLEADNKNLGEELFAHKAKIKGAIIALSSGSL
jgi:beta-lactamase regulating signal transducer with metallopeptidase domain